MKVIAHITCSSCHERIREFEPDIVLTRFDGSEKRFYHPRCEEAARRVISEEGSGTWSLTHRHLFWDTDDGAA